MLVTRTGWLAVVAVAVLLMDHAAPLAVAEVLYWEVTGRVAKVSDPDAIFGDVAINDPVRGYFCYDTSLAPDSFFGVAFYEGECAPTGPALVVENPRDHSELTIELPADGGEPLYVVGDNFSDPDLGKIVDFVNVEYLAEPPPGYQGAEPVVVFSFVGEDPIDNLALPAELNLQDWPLRSGVLFSDMSADDVSPYGEIMAEIQTIRLVDPVNQPEDFDGDTDVDGQDFLLWQRGDSPTSLGTADLANWMSQFGLGTSISVARSSTIPEPAAWFLFTLGMSAMGCHRIVVAPRCTDRHRQTGDTVQNALRRARQQRPTATSDSP